MSTVFVSELEDSSLTEIDWLAQIKSTQEPSLTSACPMSREDSESSVDGRKPRHSYASLIQMAIESSPTGLLTLSDIYQWITDHFEYYKNRSSDGWKNSIRHNLSLSKSFIRIPRGVDDPGKGSYWTVNPSCPVHQPGSRPARRRKRRPTPLLAVAPYVPEVDIRSIPGPGGFQGLQDLSKMERKYLQHDSSTTSDACQFVTPCSNCPLEASAGVSEITRQKAMNSDPPASGEDVNYAIPVDIDFSSLESLATDQWDHGGVIQDWKDFDWIDFL